MNRREKIFSAMIFATIIFFCGQNNFANAQDVYAGNTGGLDFYVGTNSITPTDPYDKEGNKGRSPDGGQHNWVFDYYLSGKGHSYK